MSLSDEDRILQNGLLEGKIAATQMPSRTAEWVVFKAPAANSGNVYFGGAGVTALVTGSSNTSCGLQLAPGEWSPVLPATDLDNFFYICDDVNSVLLYQVFQ